MEDFNTYMEKKFNKLIQQVDSLHKEFYKKDTDMTAEKVLSNWARRLRECESSIIELSNEFHKTLKRIKDLETWVEQGKVKTKSETPTKKC